MQAEQQDYENEKAVKDEQSKHGDKLAVLQTKSGHSQEELQLHTEENAIEDSLREEDGNREQIVQQQRSDEGLKHTVTFLEQSQTSDPKVIIACAYKEETAPQQTEGIDPIEQEQAKSANEDSVEKVIESITDEIASWSFFVELMKALTLQNYRSLFNAFPLWWEAWILGLTVGTKKLKSFCLASMEISKASVSKISMRTVCNKLLNLETLQVTYDDFESETSEFKRLLLLDAVCEAFRIEHASTIEAYASTCKDEHGKEQPVIIALNEDEPLQEELSQEVQKYRGFKVLHFPFHKVSTDSIRAENYAKENALQNGPDKKEELSKIVEFHADNLFESHSNLEIIGASTIKSTKGIYTEQPTITLYCRCKSFIPYGELPFPKQLKHPDYDVEYKTDVREGYFTLSPLENPSPCDFYQELSMGCSIGVKNGQSSATLGPFVEIQGDSCTYFLTVRHLFQPLDVPCEAFEKSQILQPAEEDVIVNPYQSSSARQESHVCGEAVKLIFDGFVDVALVRVSRERVPNRGYFILPAKGALEFAGFSQQNFPKYDHGKMFDARKFTVDDYATERVIKFGKTTGLTKGTLELNRTAVKIYPTTSLSMKHNGRVHTEVFKNQLMISSHNPTKERRFFDLGDSGSAVFLVDKQNELHCIGIGIGTYDEYCTVVTPITTILERLSEKIGKRVKMKTFHMEQMETE